MSGKTAEAVQAKMSNAERVRLLDAAMQSADAEGYLDGAQAAFDAAGRSHDALVAAVLRALLRAGEIETVMSLRAEWSGDAAAVRPRSTSSR